MKKAELIALAAEASGEAQTSEEVTALEATARVDALTKLLRTSRSENIDVIAALDEVAEAYESAGADARARSAYRKRAEAQFLRALGRWKSPRGKGAKGNLHERAAVHAAKVLGDVAAHLDAKERKVLSTRVRKVIDNDLFAKRIKLGMSQDQLEATFAAVGRIGDPSSLAWYEKHHMRTSSVQLPVLIAAHKSLGLFVNVPGRWRHAMVKALTKNYVSVEAQAEQGNTVAERSAKRFWDELKLHTIPALQQFAGKPTNEEGEALVTVAAFREWFRARKNANRAPWLDA